MQIGSKNNSLQLISEFIFGILLPINQYFLLLFSPLFSLIAWKPGLRGFSKEFLHRLQLTKSSSADDHTVTQRERENICITIKPIVRKTALLIENTQLSLLELTDGDQTESISYICFQDTAVTERRMSRHKKAKKTDKLATERRERHWHSTQRRQGGGGGGGRVSCICDGFSWLSVQTQHDLLSEERTIYWQSRQQILVVSFH